MRTGRGEAVDLVRGWAEARALVKVELRVGPVMVGLRARPLDATAEEWRFVCEDDVTGCVLRLEPAFTFAFVDIRHLPSDPQHFEDMVVVYFSDRQASDADHFTVAVITEV